VVAISLILQRSGSFVLSYTCDTRARRVSGSMDQQACKESPPPNVTQKFTYWAKNDYILQCTYVPDLSRSHAPAWAHTYLRAKIHTWAHTSHAPALHVENISTPCYAPDLSFEEKHQINTPEQFQTKIWVDTDDAKFYVHVKLRCYKSPYAKG
jgi:hypothetical protein